jgi:hypothetical protein
MKLIQNYDTVLMIIRANIVNGNTIFIWSDCLFSEFENSTINGFIKKDRISLRKLRDGIKTTTWNSSKFRAKVLLFGIHENKF